MPEQPRPMRADAARNRARVLDVAYAVFAEEGLSVPIDEIARRAGVGAGTVYRHFPTKEALFGAIAANRLQHLVDRAAEVVQGKGPGEAFFGYFDFLVEEGSTDQGLVEALAGAGIDLVAAVPDAERTFMALLDDLLTRAQRAGAVRPDLTVTDLKALLVGCQAMRRQSADPAVARRSLAVVCDGMAHPAAGLR